MLEVDELWLAREVAEGRRALARCGYWPVVATLAQYRAAVDLAGHEVSLTYEIERRYRRRFGHPTNAITLERLYTRRNIAWSLLDQRCVLVNALCSQPEGAA